jgi:hypothetical protein
VSLAVRVQHLFKPGQGTVVDALYDVSEVMEAAGVTGQQPEVYVDFPRRLNFSLAPLLEGAPQVGTAAGEGVSQED